MNNMLSSLKEILEKLIAHFKQTKITQPIIVEEKQVEQEKQIMSKRLISDEVLGAMTIYQEARSESVAGRIAVGEVIRNRVKRGTWGNSVADVVLSPYQFSGWNTKDANRVITMKLMDDDPLYLECLDAWKKSETTNYASKAMYYFNPKVVATPSWALGKVPVVKIGNHNFYIL